IHERHHVLKLIAKSEGAARLIERRTPAHATGQRLIQQPAINQRVHRRIRRLDFDRAEHLVPKLKHALERLVNFVQVAKMRVDFASFVDRLSLAQQKDHFASLSGREFDLRLNRCTRIEARAIASAGRDRLPLRPMNSVRSHVIVNRSSLVPANVMRSANSLLYELRAKIAPSFSSRSVTTWTPDRSRSTPITSSL